MPITSSELHSLIRSKFPDADITITDLAGDNDHYQVKIISSIFKGKTRVMQHRMVNEALKGTVGETLHAMALITEVKSDP
jgi:stress-induced morphogen